MRIPHNHKVVILFLIGSIHLLYSSYLLVNYKGYLFAFGLLYALIGLVFYFTRLYWIFEKKIIAPKRFVHHLKKKTYVHNPYTGIYDDDSEERTIWWWLKTPILPRSEHEWFIAVLFVILSAAFFIFSLDRLFTGYLGMSIFYIWK